MLCHISVLNFLLILSDTPLYRYTTFYLPIHQLMDIWLISLFGLLWLMLPWTFLYKFLGGWIYTYSICFRLTSKKCKNKDNLHLYFKSVIMCYNILPLGNSQYMEKSSWSPSPDIWQEHKQLYPCTCKTKETERVSTLSALLVAYQSRSQSLHLKN